MKKLIKNIMKGLCASLFVYALMLNGQYTGYWWNTIGDCNAAAYQAGPGYYCIWSS